MFMGSIPAAMRQYVKECVTAWQPDELYVGCSGNFTIERCLPDVRHHGNDVTLYSSAIGWWAAGNESLLSQIRLNDDGMEHLPWLKEHFDDPDELIAVIMLGTRFMASVGKDNVYHRRMVEAHHTQWDRLMEKTVGKVRESGFKLESYVAGDVREWLAHDVPAEAPVAMFPPFFTGDYKNMFAPLEKFIAWPEPEYGELDEVGKDALIQQIVDRPQWMIGVHEERPELADHLHGRVQTTNRGVPIFLYASAESPRRVVAPHQMLEQVRVPRLGPDDELTGEEKVTLGVLNGGQFSTLRSQYMNHTIKPGSPLLAFALLLDDKIAGVFALNGPDSKFGVNEGYLLSDFPVVPTRYKRLAALVVRCAQSAEARDLLQRSVSRRITGLSTTAYSNNPASMKYRSGGMKLLTRKPGMDGHHKYTLQYGAEMGQWSLADAYAAWFKKHGQARKDEQ